ncbi:sodium:solute symporter family protein [Nocardioides sp. GY 10127]|uniref:sodium:solute symporter family protein n=1 Tax=Nocardioides sp. GY 10127 TaxID=2569762 RepID=UPI0010A7B07F|nr:sodium:solute symporter family protein [Nocardioides sp. GY 10127]TIC82768.1 sodium:solute symporter family protein [Nocardioides sp. GY 10127]
MILMMGMLLVFYAVVVGILYVTQKTDHPNFEEYAVGNRSYGPIYIAASYINSWWPGSTWTAFFGLAAGSGVFGLYGLAYSIVGVATMYFMATRAWRWGSVYDLRTQPDLIGLRFDSDWAKKIASFIGVVSLFPWVILGMQALGTLFDYAGDGHWGIKTSLFIGLAAIVIRQFWTVKMGMRGLILTDVFQSIVAYGGTALIAVLMMLGVGGSPISITDVSNVAGDYLKMPGDGGTYGPLYIFALIFTGVIGSLCWPTSFQRIYTASGVRAVKKGTVQTAFLSGLFYTLLMFIGLAVASTGLAADNPQVGWFTVMNDWGGTFFLGLAIVIVFAASMGHIDASVQVSGLQIANDLVQGKERKLSDAQLTRISKASMAVFMILAAVLAYATRDMSRMQLLAQMSYQGIVQLAVPLFLGIFWRGGNKYGAISGMVGGFATAAVLTWIFPDDIHALGSLTGGIVGLAVNLVLFFVVSAITGRTDEEKARVDEFFDVAAGKKKPVLTTDLVV